jgi:HAD superfamily hydrolase (TIGR01549 family)
VPTRAITFDLFDTLVDLFMEGLPEVTVEGQRVRSTYGLLYEAAARRADIPFETFARELRLVDREVWDARNRGLEFPTLDRFRRLVQRLALDVLDLAEELTAIHMGKIREQAGVLQHHEEVLGELHRELRIGVCSNFSHTPTALEVLRDARLLPHLDAVVISEEVGIRKPKREIFEETLRRLGARPEETIHVGDRLDADVAGAAALGMRSVWITRRSREPDRQLREHAGPKPSAVIRDLAELPALIER